MITNNIIKKLRNREPLLLFNRKTKEFHHVQYKGRGSWEKFVSWNRRNWRKQNAYLSLKDVLNLRAQIAIDCQEMCFNKER